MVGKRRGSRCLAPLTSHPDYWSRTARAPPRTRTPHGGCGPDCTTVGRCRTMEHSFPRDSDTQKNCDLNPPPSLATKSYLPSTGFILSECVSECVAPSLSRNCISYSNLVNLACTILATSLLCVCFISCCKIVDLHLSHLPVHNTPINLLPEPHNFPRYIVNKLLEKCSQFVFVFSFIGPAWFGSEF